MLVADITQNYIWLINTPEALPAFNKYFHLMNRDNYGITHLPEQDSQKDLVSQKNFEFADRRIAFVLYKTTAILRINSLLSQCRNDIIHHYVLKLPLIK